jgi:sulfatase modifying factor 1
MRKRTLIIVVAVFFVAFTLASSSTAQTNAPRITSAVWTNGAFSLAWTNSGTNAVTIERRTSLASGSWTAIGSNNVAGAHSDTNTPVGSAFYRLRMVTGSNAPANMALIPAGSFSMGDALGDEDFDDDELPVHTVNVSAFYMDKYEVTKALWSEVRAWGLTNGYTDLPVGFGETPNHPVTMISWYSAVKWCNARSQKEGLTPCYTVSSAVYKIGSSDAVVLDMGASGYRLPTEAEWEKAARGGLSGKRFPWGDTISHSQANYYSDASYSYDVSPTRGDHPTYVTNSGPPHAPVGSFAPNGYGLYDMAGNAWERCWDWYDSTYYASSPSSDPLGAETGWRRVMRGGASYLWPDWCRVANRDYDSPAGDTGNGIGFRCVRR